MHNIDLTAVIPVRAGSRRLKNKNIRKFAGSNLLVHKIDQLKKVPEIDKIYVSSDSDEMLKIAADCGAMIHKRDIKFCDEKTVPFGGVVKHIASSIDGEHVLWATCTSPLVSPNIYSEAITKYFEVVPTQFDSLMSVEIIKRYLWDDNGPINYKLGLKHVPSQELPNIYRITDGILISPRKKMIEWSYFHGPNPYKFICDKKSAVDIDDIYDLEQAKAWFNLD